MQKHQAFEAELSANQSRIDALEKAGQKLIDVDHYAKDEVAARMNEVISLWKKLLEATELKGEGKHARGCGRFRELNARPWFKYLGHLGELHQVTGHWGSLPEGVSCVGA